VDETPLTCTSPGYKYPCPGLQPMSPASHCRCLPLHQHLHLQAEQQGHAHAETNPQLYQHFSNLMASLPSSEEGLEANNFQLHRHDHGWNSSPQSIIGSMVADACFSARASDIIAATHPKCGTTWIKALLYAVVHRREHPSRRSRPPFQLFQPP
jgi:hydroxyjasmonate sulfotransferase